MVENRRKNDVTGKKLAKIWSPVIFPPAEVAALGHTDLGETDTEYNNHEAYNRAIKTVRTSMYATKQTIQDIHKSCMANVIVKTAELNLTEYGSHDLLTRIITI